MRTRAALGALLALAALHGAASAQVSEERVRRAIEDASRGLGQTLAGGSALAGPANTTGGLGHFTLSVAVAATRVDIDDPSRSESELEFVLPVGTVNLGLGLARGWDLAPAVEGLGSVDLIGRVGLLVEREDLQESATLYAVGARIGILRQNLLAPAVSVTALRSWSEDLEHAGGGVRYEGDVRATSIRADVSKSLLLVTPYAGAGIDRTEIDAAYRIAASASTGGGEITGSIDEESTHHKVYGGLELALALIDVALEIGAYDGGAFAVLAAKVGM